MSVQINKLKFCTIIVLMMQVPYYSYSSRLSDITKHGFILPQYNQHSSELSDIANRDFKLWQYNQRMNKIDKKVGQKMASILQAGLDKETTEKKLDLLFLAAQEAKRAEIQREAARKQALKNFSRDVAIRYQRENPLLGRLATVLLPRGL